MILQKKQHKLPLAPGKIIVSKAGIYNFTPIPKPLPKKKSTIPKIPEGIEFQILLACCEIVEGKTGPDNQVQITKRQTFVSTRIIKNNDTPLNQNGPKSRF
ncbi:MAG: hypothetical protein Q8P20_04995 [bacterium]|nr:hypothetical protein [bacterium]